MYIFLKPQSIKQPGGLVYEVTSAPVADTHHDTFSEVIEHASVQLAHGRARDSVNNAEFIDD